MKRQYQIGDWVLVKFPKEENYISHTIQGYSYHDLTVIEVYQPQDSQIQMYQERVMSDSYYWYGRQPTMTTKMA